VKEELARLEQRMLQIVRDPSTSPRDLQDLTLSGLTRAVRDAALRNPNLPGVTVTSYLRSRGHTAVWDNPLTPMLLLETPSLVSCALDAMPEHMHSYPSETRPETRTLLNAFRTAWAAAGWQKQLSLIYGEMASGRSGFERVSPFICAVYNKLVTWYTTPISMDRFGTWAMRLDIDPGRATRASLEWRRGIASLSSWDAFQTRSDMLVPRILDPGKPAELRAEIEAMLPQDPLVPPWSGSVVEHVFPPIEPLVNEPSFYRNKTREGDPFT
jgi:hypothetical protein